MRDMAAEIIAESLEAGLKQGNHEINGWLKDDNRMHVMKAARHAMTAGLMSEGYSRKDQEGVEGHLSRVLTRAAMALYQLKLKSSRSDSSSQS